MDVTVEKALEMKAERLKEVCENTLYAPKENFDEKKVKLTWELLSQRTQTLRKLLNCIDATINRSKWGESRLVFLTRLIQHTHLTGQIVQAGCLSDTYGDRDTQNALLFMGQLLDKKMNDANMQIKGTTNHLQILEHLPQHIVQEAPNVDSFLIMVLGYSIKHICKVVFRRHQKDSESNPHSS
jgi:hypothetical protein